MVSLAIAGAGIGGLAAAVALAHRGFDTLVFERRDTLGEAGAGLQLSPNATRHLTEWGLLPNLLRRATRADAVRIRRGRDATELACVPVSGAPAEAPFLLLHRADLQACLAEAAARTGRVRLCLASEVREVKDAGDGVHLSVQGASSREVIAPGLVDAGGIRASAAFRGGRQGGPAHTGQTAWRSLVPAAELAPVFQSACSNLWLGPKTHLVHYPLRGGTVINVVAIVEQASKPHAGSVDIWSEPGEPAELLCAFRDWNRLPKALLEAAPTWHKWPLFETRPGLPWSRGRRTVLGDAAHAMLPFLAQGASQAIEDAAALSKAVAQATGDLPRAFQVYEQSRRHRAEQVQKASRRQGRIYHLSGPAAFGRDSVMRLMGSDTMLKSMAWLYEPR
jgi:salicylate hydroxylase